MLRPAGQGSTTSVTARIGLGLCLSVLALPVLAASGLSLSCDSSTEAAKPADLTATTALPAETGGESESLKAVKTDADVATTSDKLRILDSEFDADPAVPVLEKETLRSSALADALERRRRDRLELPPTGRTDNSDIPKVETRLPGVGEEESMLYRREMYRTDI